MKKNEKIDTETLKKLIEKYTEQNKALEELLKKIQKKKSKEEK